MDGKNLSLGVLKCIKAALNKEIKEVKLEDNELKFIFSDNTKIKLWDAGQSCCELRYMQTDDDLKYFSGAILLGFELKDAPNVKQEENDCDAHEIQFLEVKTSKGVFTLANHNEHNGWYGGFWMKAESEPKPAGAA